MDDSDITDVKMEVVEECSLPPRAETTKRQIQKFDSGISDEKSEDSDDSSKRKKHDDANETSTETFKNKLKTSDVEDNNGEHKESFPILKSNVKKRNYRSHSRSSDAKSSSEDETSQENVEETLRTPKNKSPDSGLVEVESGNSNLNENVSFIPETREDEGLGDNMDNIVEDDSRVRNSSSSSSSTSALEDDISHITDSENDEDCMPSVLIKPKPKHSWFIIPEVMSRQLGSSNRKQSSKLFQERMYGSLHSVQRLELMYKLEHHTGCVNSLGFNLTGTILASCSDDLLVCLWDWPVGKLKSTFQTGHKSNVFQAKFLPFHNDTYIATSSRDGQVRLIEISTSGQVRSSRRVAQHRGPVHKLALSNDSQHVFLSGGEDAYVNSIDIRQPKSHKVLQVKEGVKKVPLYAIHSNPMNSNHFLVSGRDNYVRLYDQRNLTEPFKKICPHGLVNGLKDIQANVTCAVYNHNGTEVLASYNDDDIYLFDTKQSDQCDFIHRYQGHRNNATVKGVNFFGPNSEFIISGSDCGNIYMWEKKTESIVQWMAGDENGVVNCLEPHPDIPVLATSGLDEDVKVWVPSCEQGPTMNGLKTTVKANQIRRDGDRSQTSDPFDGHMLWILWRHIRRTERMREQRQLSQSSRRGSSGDVNNQRDSSSSDVSGSSDDEDEEEDDPSGQGSRFQCAPS